MLMLTYWVAVLISYSIKQDSMMQSRSFSQGKVVQLWTLSSMKAHKGATWTSFKFSLPEFSSSFIIKNSGRARRKYLVNERNFINEKNFIKVFVEWKFSGKFSLNIERNFSERLWCCRHPTTDTTYAAFSLSSSQLLKNSQSGLKNISSSVEK